MINEDNDTYGAICYLCISIEKALFKVSFIDDGINLFLFNLYRYLKYGLNYI